MTSTLVLFTKNEIEASRALFNKIPWNAFSEAFVIDYRSVDGTLEFFESHGIRVVRQNIPGRGEAFRMAAQIAKGDIVVLLSADGNDDPADAPRLAALVARDCDMAVASRFMKGARNDEADKLFPWRAWANQTFTFIANICFGGRMTDTITGFRAIRRDKLLLLNLDAQGFTIEYQTSIRAMKLKLKICEMPTVEGDRIGGKSTASAIPTGLRVLKVLMRELWIGKKF